LRYFYHYATPKNPDLEYAFKWASETHLFSKIDELIGLDGLLVLPRSIHYLTTDCGTENAFYTPKFATIVLCYELIDSLRNMGQALSKDMADPKAFTAEFVRDNVRFILLHETGHALIDLLQLPAVGREEDAVDQLATVSLLFGVGDGNAKRENARVLQLASTWFMINSSRSSPGMAHFADEHSLDAQRYYNILCIAYGRDPEEYRGLVTKGLLPQSRAARCRDESAKIFNSWSRLLLPHLAPRYRPAEKATNKGDSAVPPPQRKNPLEWDGKSNPFGS
jgi:hypothetical protein